MAVTTTTPRDLHPPVDDVPAQLAELGLAVNRARLDAALDRIGHQGNSQFRERLAAAFNQTPAPVGLVLRCHVSLEAAAAIAPGRTPAELAELGLALKEAFERAMTSPDVVDAVNIAVGEVALDLGPDDPRRAGLTWVQDGLDAIWREASTIAEAVS